MVLQKRHEKLKNELNVLFAENYYSKDLFTDSMYIFGCVDDPGQCESLWKQLTKKTQKETVARDDIVAVIECILGITTKNDEIDQSRRKTR